MENTALQQLFIRYLAGEASPEEVKLLFREFGKADNEIVLREAIRRRLESGHDVPEQVRQAWEPVLQDAYESIKFRIAHKRQTKNEHDALLRIHRRKWLKYSAAAIALLAASSIYIFWGHKKGALQQTETVQRHDIAPGGNRAILTLANGTKIMLDSARTGVISVQGNTKIMKPNNGLLTYYRSNTKHSKILFNTIATPKGGQYQIELSDGTKVWLNDASSIYFPNEFTEKTREVRITGEAYFEVADDVKMPFKVLVNDMTIQVLGTHFNVMAYKDEPVAKVTLLQGAVKVIKGDKSILLNPGQQAQLSSPDRLVKVEHVDLQGTIAWKNNQFWFSDDSIQTVMRRLSRWYNVDVMIKGKITQHFGGYISRNIYVSKVFEALQATGHLQYKIQDSTIIVSP